MSQLPLAVFSMLAMGLVSSVSAADSGGYTGPEGRLIVANKGDHSISIVDPAAGKQLGTVPENGVTGHEVIASPDGKTAYVPIYGDSGVGKPGSDGRNLVVIDLASQKVTGSVDFGHGVRPHCPMFGPKNGMLYVSTELDQTISVIDPKTLKIVGSVPTGQAESHMFVLSHDGHFAYTANVGPGTVSVIDLDAKKTVAVIPVSRETQRIAISPDDQYVFTSDQTKPQLAVIDTAAKKVKTWVPLPGTGYGGAITSTGKYLVIALPAVNKVAVVDLKSMEVVHSIDVPKSPQETLISPDDQFAYASCSTSNQVAVINLSTWKVDKLIDVGGNADGLAWAAMR